MPSFVDQLWRFWALVWPGALWIIFSSLPLTWPVYRRIKYLRAALHREKERNLSWQTETVDALLTIFLHAQNPTLRELVDSTDQDFSLPSSERP